MLSSFPFDFLFLPNIIIAGDILPAPVGATDLNIVKMSSKRFDLTSLEPVQTVLYPSSTEPFLTYENISWSLHVRKEVSLTVMCLFQYMYCLSVGNFIDLYFICNEILAVCL